MYDNVIYTQKSNVFKAKLLKLVLFAQLKKNCFIFVTENCYYLPTRRYTDKLLSKS